MNLNPKNINIVGIVSFFCKDTLFFWKFQGIIEKCLRMRIIKGKSLPCLTSDGAARVQL